MKVTLHFNLPEEQEVYQDAIDGWKWKYIVDQLCHELNVLDEIEAPSGARKYHSKTLDAVRTKLVELINEEEL